MVEYRVLSSAMMDSVAKLTFIWEQLQKAVKAYNVNYDLPDPEEIQESINNSNVALAKQLINKYELA